MIPPTKSKIVNVSLSARVLLCSALTQSSTWHHVLPHLGDTFCTQTPIDIKILGEQFIIIQTKCWKEKPKFLSCIKGPKINAPQIRGRQSEFPKAWGQRLAVQSLHIPRRRPCNTGDVNITWASAAQWWIYKWTMGEAVTLPQSKLNSLPKGNIASLLG